MADVTLEKVSKSYGAHRVIDDLTITIRDGECFTFLGPSGCGKTVVLRMIAGFEQPSSGRVWIGDRCVSSPAEKIHIPPEERHIGVVFQDYAVWPHKSVFDNIAYPLKIQKVPRDEARERSMRAVADVNLQGLERRLPYQLSGGQQQRVALARALVARPEIMLLDEPLSNLDANLREEMRFEIKELQRGTGVTILYVTHDQEVALAISDRIAIMDRNGYVRQVGTPEEVYERPRDSFVFTFMGVSNFIPLEERGGKVFVRGDGEPIGLPVPADRVREVAAGEIVAGCRPFDVKLVRNPAAGAMVKRAVYLGTSVDYRVDVGGEEIRVEEEVHAGDPPDAVFREGERVDIAFRELKWFEKEGRALEAEG